MTIGEWAARLRYRYVPDHIVGEVLGRRWMDNVIPVTLLIALTIYLTAAIPNFISFGNLSDISRQIGEFGLIVIGMTIVMLAGGIDLSVGSNFALANVTALALINVAKWPVEAAVAATVGVGALVGLINGLLIGFLRLRAFLTTLVMLTLIRAVVEFLLRALFGAGSLRATWSPRPGTSSAPDRFWARRSASWFWSSSAIVAPVRPDPAAHRLAHHGGRRIASRRIQRRHPRARAPCA